MKCLPTEGLNDRALDRTNLSITDDLNLALSQHDGALCA